MVKYGQKVVSMTAFPVAGILIHLGGNRKGALSTIQTKKGELHHVPPSLIIPYLTLDQLEKKRREQKERESIPLANRVYKRGQRKQRGTT